MKMLLLLFLITVLLVSGCTNPESPQTTGSGMPDASGNQSDAVLMSVGPGLHCGSFRINGSLVSTKMDTLIEAARQAGFSFIGMVVDPNQPGQLDACDSVTAAGMLCIPCQETGNNEGTLVAIGVREEISPDQSLETMLDQVHGLGGVAYITQPMSNAEGASWKRWDITTWDGLAVISTMAQTRHDDERAIEEWHDSLNRGQYSYAFGETDIKPFTTTYELSNALDSSYQCLWIQENLTEDSLKKTLGSGRFYVTNGPALNFTVNGRSPGSDFNVSYGEEVELSIDVVSDSLFSVIKIIRDGEVLQETGRQAIRYNMTLNTTIVSRTWFAVEVWGNDNTPDYHDPVHAISNPVWVGVG